MSKERLMSEGCGAHVGRRLRTKQNSVAGLLGLVPAVLLLAMLGCGTREAVEPTGDSTASAWDSSAALTRSTAAVQALLDEQTLAWNRGDIPAFMDGYWKSPELRFASGGQVNRGWQVTLDGYLARYPDRAAMGQLRFEDREINVIGPNSAIAFGRWILDRESDQPQGLFTLLLRRFDGDHQAAAYAAAEGWRVVADHTSSAE